MSISRERDIYRDALERIASEESGPWGTIAHQALRAGAELPAHFSPASPAKVARSAFNLERDGTRSR